MRFRIERKSQSESSHLEHEEMFLQRYERLFGWALSLTGGQRSGAEDMVHDAYVRFVVSCPDLATIKNLDGYLRCILMYLYLAQKRRAAKTQDLFSEIADYDSATIGVRALDLQIRLQAQEDLLQICQYACVRKETSRAGSIFILRFFHDYSSNEAMRVLRSSSDKVDAWLWIARHEARLCLKDRRELKFMAGKPKFPYKLSFDLRESPDVLMQRMRIAIFQSRRGSCLSPRQLEALYSRDNDDRQIACATLGHIVSCPFCLDRVNGLLGLPLLSSRHSAHKPKPDSDCDHDDGSGWSGDSMEAFLMRGRAEVRRIIEHRPEALYLSANGSHIGTMPITSESSKIQLSIHDRSVEFIEVFSEQGVRMLFLEILPQRSQQSLRIRLSAGREIEVCFDRGALWPLLKVSYYDPLMRIAGYDPHQKARGAVA